jgi:hypothetical protein
MNKGNRCIILIKTSKRGTQRPHQENTMALGASFYLLDTLEVPFCTLEMLQVCFKCVKKVTRSSKEPQGQLCFSDGLGERHMKDLEVR